MKTKITTAKGSRGPSANRRFSLNSVIVPLESFNIRNACTIAIAMTICAVALLPLVGCLPVENEIPVADTQKGLPNENEIPVVDAETAYQWQPHELTFVTEREHESPFDYRMGHLVGTFVGPNGEKLEIPGFYDGERNWKIRFTPTTPGTWRYTTASSHTDDVALHGRSGQIDVEPATGDNPLFRHGGFLKVSENRRHLTYTDGTPFFWLGGTWWFSPSKLTPLEGSSNPEIPSAFRKIVDTRAKQNFSVAHMGFLGPEKMVPGLSGFERLKPTSWKPNHVAYWQEVDRYIRYANKNGIIPVVGMCFHRDADVVSLDEFKQLWAYFMARYGAMPIGVLFQGEYNQKKGQWEERIEKVLALGSFLKKIDPYQRALTVHPWHFGPEGREAWDEPWYDFIMIQGGHGVPPEPELYLDTYRRSTPKPLLQAEGPYEGTERRGIYNDDQNVRHGAYKAIQSGSFGFTYGSHGLWYPNQNAEDNKFSEWGPPIPWWEALARPGATQMQHLRTVYESVPWWKLEPQPEAIEPSCDVFTKAAGDDTFLLYFTSDGNVPEDARLVTVETGTAYTAQWFNPRSGQFNSIAEELIAGPKGLPLPTRPDNHDWMLILNEKRE